MTTITLKNLYDEMLETVGKAAYAEKKGDDPSAYKHYKEAREQFSRYIKQLEETFRPHLAMVEAIEKKLNRGSSNTDVVQVGFFRTDPSPKSYVVKLSDGKLNAVGGLEKCKQVLREAAIWPKKYPQFFTGNRKPWRAVLLFGPPGSGKTLLAETIAAEVKFNFLSISPSDIVCKWMGDSEQHVSDLFQEARKKAPSIIFIDEIDSLCGPRGENNENEPSRRIKSELLIHMQDVCNSEDYVLILAATNTPYALDQAIRRRFDMRIYIPLPHEEARKRIFEVEIGNTPSTIDKKGLENLAKETEGFSGSDISSYVKDALYQSIRATLRAEFFFETEDKVWVPYPKAGVSQEKKPLAQLEKENKNSQIKVPTITLEHFVEVKERHKPTVSAAVLEELKKFKDEFGVDA